MTVRCLTCHRVLNVDFADCLAHGWPKCHGQTMRLLDSPPDVEIDAAVGGIVRAAKPAPDPRDEGEPDESEEDWR